MSSTPSTRETRHARSGPEPPGWLGVVVGIAVCLAAAFKLRGYLDAGLPIFFDAHSHVARSWMAERAFAAGSFPSWSNDWYGGFRLLEFYSPLYYWLTGGLALVTGDVISATKGVLWAAQVAAAGAMYWLVRRISSAPLVAAFAAGVLLFSAERAALLGSVGNYPASLLLVGVPLLLGSCLGLAAGKLTWSRFVAFHAMLLTALFSTHLSNMAAILPSLLACEGVLLWQGLSARVAKPGAHAVTALAVSTLAALLASTFFLAPMLADLDLVSLSLHSRLSFSLGPLGSVLGLRAYDLDFPFAHDQGLVWWLLSGAGCAIALAPAYRAWRGFALGLLVCLACTAVIGERGAVGLLFFIAPLASLCVHAIGRALEAWGGRRASLAVSLAALLALVASPQPRAEQDPRYLPEQTLALYAALPDSRYASRTLDITGTALSIDGIYGWSSFSPVISGRAVPFGAFPQGAPLDHLISLALASQLVRDLAESPPVLSRDSLDLLYLLHVEFLVDRGLPASAHVGRFTLLPHERASSLRLSGSVGKLLPPGRIRLRYASPAIFAPEVESLARASAAIGVPWPPKGEAHASASPLLAVLRERWRDDPLGEHPDPSLDVMRRAGRKHDAAPLIPYLRRLELDRSSGRAQRLLLNERDAGEISQQPNLGGQAGAARAQPGGQGEFEVLAQRESASLVELAARAEQPGFLRLAYSHDAAQRVTLDGKPVAHYADPLGSGIILAFPAGRHRVLVDSSASRTVLPWAGLSLLVILGLLALARR